MGQWSNEVMEKRRKTKQKQHVKNMLLPFFDKSSGFTLLEVMVAISIIAITLVAVFGSQSQSLSLANDAKFSTIAALLAQSKMAEIETVDPEDLTSDSGDFGDRFPDYHWNLRVQDISFAGTEEILNYLKQIDLSLFYGEKSQYRYDLRLYQFVHKTK